MMKTIIFSIFAVLACGLFGASAEDPLWSDFRGSFLLAKQESFAPFPRTIRDSIFTSENWTAVTSEDDCTNGGRFNGIQYVKNGDYSVGLLYDVNGVIAGIQMLIPHSTVLTEGNRMNYAAVPIYQNATYNGDNYFVLTVYLVEPSTICESGRSDSDLEEEGTGTGLWLQNGSSPSQSIQVPSTRPEGDEATESGWTENNCFLAMGAHNFYQADQYEATNCTQMFPIFGLYNRNKELHGFGFITPGNIDNPRFEHPPQAAIKMILGNMGGDQTPQCVLDTQDTEGLTSLHVYFIKRPWLITCPIFKTIGSYFDSATRWLRTLG